MLLKPVLVEASDKLFDQLGVSNFRCTRTIDLDAMVECSLLNYENIYKYGVVGGLKVEKKDQLFPRLDATIEVPYIQEKMNGN